MSSQDYQHSDPQEAIHSTRQKFCEMALLLDHAASKAGDPQKKRLLENAGRTVSSLSSLFSELDQSFANSEPD